MQTAAPPLLPIFRSGLQGRLLALMLPYPEREATISELARFLEADHSTVSREVDRLVEGGLLSERRVGRSRVSRANTSSPYHHELSTLVLKAFGPVELLRERMGNISGVERVVVFGSWAARFEGEPGPAPSDLDVLVVGRPDRTAVYRAARELSGRLGLEVHAVIVKPEEWEASDERLFREVRAGHHVTVFVGVGG